MQVFAPESKNILQIQKYCLYLQSRKGNGVLAQLVERLNGIQKVRSSILLCSTEQTENQSLRFSYAPRNRLKISHLRHLRINLRIKLAEFMRNFFYYPPLYFDCFWAGPTGELSGNPPRHTSGNTQKNPAPRKEGRKLFSESARGPDSHPDYSPATHLVSASMVPDFSPVLELT